MLLPGTSRMRQNKTLMKHISISAESSFSSFPNFLKLHSTIWGFPGGSDGKEHTYKAGDLGSIRGSGRPREEGMANPLQNFCLEISMDRGAWRAFQFIG